MCDDEGGDTKKDASASLLAVASAVELDAFGKVDEMITKMIADLEQELELGMQNIKCTAGCEVTVTTDVEPLSKLSLKLKSDNGFRSPATTEISVRDERSAQ